MLMFGTILFVPVYFQIVRGDTATNAGLLLMPQMIGILVGTIGAGRLTTRTGRYKIFPIVGLSLLAAVVLRAVADRSPTRRSGSRSICMVFVGAGIGMTTPALMLVGAERGADTDDVGAGDVGDDDRAVDGLGAGRGGVRRGAHRPARTPSWRRTSAAPRAGSIPRLLRGSPDQIAALPHAVQHGVIESFADALSTVFLAAVPIAILAFVIVVFLPELPLRTRDGDARSRPSPLRLRPERLERRPQ